MDAIHLRACLHYKPQAKMVPCHVDSSCKSQQSDHSKCLQQRRSKSLRSPMFPRLFLLKVSHFGSLKLWLIIWVLTIGRRMTDSSVLFAVDPELGTLELLFHRNCDFRCCKYRTRWRCLHTQVQCFYFCMGAEMVSIIIHASSPKQ